MHLAVASNSGSVSIREITFVKGSDLNKIVCNLKVAQEWIECLSYNPEKTQLAVGSHDNNIYVFSCPKYQQIYCLTGHSSFITALDWSLSGDYIRSVCGGYELLFFDMLSGKQDKAGASNTTVVTWASQTCKLGWSVQGIYPMGADGTHINSVA